MTDQQQMVQTTHLCAGNAHTDYGRGTTRHVPLSAFGVMDHAIGPTLPLCDECWDFIVWRQGAAQMGGAHLRVWATTALGRLEGQRDAAHREALLREECAPWWDGWPTGDAAEAWLRGWLSGQRAARREA